MDNPALQESQKLPIGILIKLIEMYSPNWLAVDGLWFSGVEEKHGLDAGLEMDPYPHPDDAWCQWEFSLPEKDLGASPQLEHWNNGVLE